MPNYTTLLKTWGDSGAEYPTGYSYIEGEQPVDAWDNFLIHNVVKDLQNLIDTTNNDLLSRSGGSLLSDLTVGENALVSGAGSVDFSGTEITADAIVNVLQDLKVGGTVDGVDVSSHAANASAHHTRYANSEAISAINSENALSVDITGDADTLDGFHASELGLTIEDDGTVSVSNSTGINFTEHLSVTNDGDGTVTIDPSHTHDGRYARLFDGVQAPVFATLADVPASIGKGELVFIDSEGKLYVEDGN